MAVFASVLVIRMSGLYLGKVFMFLAGVVVYGRTMSNTATYMQSVIRQAKIHWQSQERGWRAVVLAICLVLLVILGDVTIPW